jgi:hypothetical protein
MRGAMTPQRMFTAIHVQKGAQATACGGAWVGAPSLSP